MLPRRVIFIALLSTGSPTMIIASSSMVGALNLPACSPDGVLSTLMTIFAANDVIWKQELNLRVMRKNNVESRDSSARSDCRGSGGLRRGNKTTFPNEFHMPNGSQQNFKAWQYRHI
ncbi:hypothetical protein CEXT_724981 [Caerostris extrusa]|uniref:Secreted protein n=1 Tax=Caerostris extrusa TaxID=172846 RepID=A0AAV4RJZ0_CAEEX|nr:hypothetical protein CEXT_724981 [Caerostris extrusa]